MSAPLIVDQQPHSGNEQLTALTGSRRAEKIKAGDFLTNMSHALRTPLNTILGMSEALQDEVYGRLNERQLHSLQTIERSGSQLLALINDILDLAKIEAGQLALNYSLVEVEHLCLVSLDFVKQHIHQQKIHLDVQIPSHLPQIRVDERRIRQALIYLLHHVLQYTPPTGQLSIRVSPDQSSLRIVLTHSGPGIPPTQISQIFQPFQQIDAPVSPQDMGTGLELLLSKQLVELHGGHLSVSSTIGVGSCFTLQLPSQALPPAVSSSKAITAPPPAPTSNKSPLILLAEDNEATLTTFSNYLVAKGYRMVLACNGQEAIELTHRHRPDLILMDIQMPVLDGLTAIQHIRGNQTFTKTPIVALTALAMPGDQEKCIAAGATAYLAKPVKLKQLTATIQTLLPTPGMKA